MQEKHRHIIVNCLKKPPLLEVEDVTVFQIVTATPD